MSELRIALISALLASILTFLVARMGSFLNRLKKRNVQNLNALVRLEHLIIEYGMIVNDNKQNMEVIESAIKKPNAIPLNRLGTIPIDQSTKVRLLDIKLINKVVDIEYSLRRFNDDAQMINYHLNEFQRALLSGTIGQQQYNVFTQGVIGEASLYQVFMDDFLDKLAELLAYVRLRQRIDRTWTIKLLHLLASFGKSDLAAKEIKKEKTKVLGELNKSRKESIKEKEKILLKVKSDEE